MTELTTAQMRISDPELAELVERTEGVQPWRRVFHMLSAVSIALIVHLLLYQRNLVLLGLAGALVAMVGMDLARLRWGALNRSFFRVFRHLASPRETRRPASATWYLLGALLVFAFMPAWVFVPSMLVLGLADPAASVVGRLWGKRRLGKGTVKGTAVFFLVAMATLVPFVGPGRAAAGALIVAAAEILPIGVDDNLIIPLAAGAALWALGMPA